MTFVPSDEAVAETLAAVAEPHFLDATLLTVGFRTDPAVVERLLPPGLEPADDPLARAEVISVGESNCVGAFDGGGLYVRARRDDREGLYCLSMPMSTDSAVRWGRETLGEPKKLATVALDREDDRVVGRAERDRTAILELAVDLDAEREPRPGTTTIYHYRALLAVDGSGLAADPELVEVTIESSPTRVETGTASVTLGSTAHDPLADLPVEHVRDASLVETDLVLGARGAGRVDAEAYLPYAFGVGMDDWPAHANENGD
ncbi:MAG: acetoacetate decarboxylase family protein [Haloarculaceae archaeon]